MKALITTIATAAVIAAAGAASAQNYSLPSNYGDVTLYYGFSPDPFTVNLTAGGTIDASYSVSSSCRGYITNAPDVQLNYSAGSLPLIISVNSSSDTTLVINGPDGRWYCNDDADGLDPEVRFGRPSSGQYDIWVGAVGAPAPATLIVTEVP